jgi:hypothetical protein
MSRPRQHIINNRAENIFRKSVPPQHVVRDVQKDDYGIDFEIELFKNSKDLGFKTTGFIIKVQLKGTEHVGKSADASQVSFSGFELEKAEYLIEQIEIPAAIVLVDVTTESVYWTHVQSNIELVSLYEDAKANQRQSLTVHFDPINQIPMAWDQFVARLVECRNVIALKRAGRIRGPK